MQKLDIAHAGDTSELVAALFYIVADIEDEHPVSAEILHAAALELDSLRRAGSLAEARSEFALLPGRRANGGRKAGPAAGILPFRRPESVCREKSA